MRAQKETSRSKFGSIDIVYGRFISKLTLENVY